MKTTSLFDVDGNEIFVGDTLMDSDRQDQPYLRVIVREGKSGLYLEDNLKEGDYSLDYKGWKKIK